MIDQVYDEMVYSGQLEDDGTMFNLRFTKW